MSKRLQVLLDEAEYRELKRIAQRHGMTVSAWVRQALRDLRRREPQKDPDRKLAAVLVGSRYGFPTGDIEQMLAEIERD